MFGIIRNNYYDVKIALNVWKSEIVLILLTKSSNGDYFHIILHEKNHKVNVCLFRKQNIVQECFACVWDG